jgi:hypothetical protein
MTMRGATLVPADAADEGHAFGIGPGAQFFEFFVIDEEMGRATGANNCLLAISPRFAPFQYAPVGAAFSFTEMMNDRADGWTEWIIPIYPGSESIILGLQEEISLPAQRATGRVESS